MGKESDGYVRSDAVPRSTMRKMMEQRINSRTKILQEIVKQTKHDITFPPLPVHRISAHFFLLTLMMMMKPLFKCHKILVHYNTNWGH